MSGALHLRLLQEKDLSHQPYHQTGILILDNSAKTWIIFSNNLLFLLSIANSCFLQYLHLTTIAWQVNRRSVTGLELIEFLSRPSHARPGSNLCNSSGESGSRGSPPGSNPRR